MVQELLVDVVDDELATDSLLKEIDLIYYFLRDVFVTMFDCVLYTL